MPVQEKEDGTLMVEPAEYWVINPPNPEWEEGLAWKIVALKQLDDSKARELEIAFMKTSDVARVSLAQIARELEQFAGIPKKEAHLVARMMKARSKALLAVKT